MTEIRSLSAEHAAGLVPLLRQVHDLHVLHMPDLYRAAPTDKDVIAFLESWISRDTVTALIAGPAEAPHGYLIFEIEEREPSALRLSERRVMLHHICVDSARRRQGIALSLINRLREEARSLGIKRLTTTYAAFNSASAALMQSAGFAPQTVLAACSLADISE